MILLSLIIKTGKRQHKLHFFWQIRFIVLRFFVGIRRYDRTGSFSAGKSTGRRRSGRTKRLINLVRRRLEPKNIRKSLRTMSTDFQSTRSTIERVLKADLKKKCYRRKHAQKLQDEHQTHRKRNCS